MTRITGRQAIWLLAAFATPGGLVFAAEQADRSIAEVRAEERGPGEGDRARLREESGVGEQRGPDGARESGEVRRKRYGREGGYGQGYEARKQRAVEPSGAGTGRRGMTDVGRGGRSR